MCPNSLRKKRMLRLGSFELDLCTLIKVVGHQLKNRLALTQNDILVVEPIVEVKQPNRSKTSVSLSIDLSGDLFEGPFSIHQHENIMLPSVELKLLLGRTLRRNDLVVPQ